MYRRPLRHPDSEAAESEPGDCQEVGGKSSNKCHASSNRCLTSSNKEAIRIKFRVNLNLILIASLLLLVRHLLLQAWHLLLVVSEIPLQLGVLFLIAMASTQV